MRFRNRPDVQTRLGEILMTGRNLLLTRPATDTPRLTEARRPGTRAADLCGPGSGGCRPPGGRHVPGKPFACQTPPESRPAWGEWRCFTCHETYWFGPGLCPADFTPLRRVECTGMTCSVPAGKPEVWWVERRCRSCGRSYEYEDLSACPLDGAPLAHVGCSLPFLWLG